MSLPSDTPQGIADALGYLQYHLQELTKRQHVSENNINSTLAALTAQLQHLIQLVANPSSGRTEHTSPTCIIPSSVSVPCSASLADTPQALLPPRLQRRTLQRLRIPELLLSLHTPSPRAVPQRTGKDSLGSHILQRRSCRQVVQKRIPSRSKHWRFPYPNLGRLWTTIPAILLPCKCRSGRDQRFGRNFLPPRKSDGRRLFGQLPSPGLWYRLYRSPDTGGEISTRSQTRHSKPDCYHALWTTSWHRPQRVV